MRKNHSKIVCIKLVHLPYLTTVQFSCLFFRRISDRVFHYQWCAMIHKFIVKKVVGTQKWNLRRWKSNSAFVRMLSLLSLSLSLSLSFFPLTVRYGQDLGLLQDQFPRVSIHSYFPPNLQNPFSSNHFQHRLTISFSRLYIGPFSFWDILNLLKPNDIYICRTAALTSRRYSLNIYSTNIPTEYFKHAA